MREAAGDWQRDIVKALFGSVVSGQRQIREAFVLVPKKNSKTTCGSAIMLTALLVNQRPRAEFLLIAPTQEIADLAFGQAVGMIEADPVLASKFHVQGHLKRISYRQTKAFLKVKSFDPKVVTGTKPAGILLDETHVIAEAPDADRVIGQLRGGLISQPEGFLIQITTQSERPPAGVFAAELAKARKVRDGTLSAPLLPVLYEFPEGVDWQEPSNWHLVTPNNGRSITVERLIPDYEAAREASEAELRRSISTSRSESRCDPMAGPGRSSGAEATAGRARWRSCSTARRSRRLELTAAGWTTCSGSRSSRGNETRAAGCSGLMR
jgi:phage terminase large subunit-like protein